MNITVGNVTVRLYETPVKSGGKVYPSWIVSWIGPEGRQRKRFKDEQAAERWAHDKADALNRGMSVSWSAEEVASYRRAHDALEPTGKAMETVALEYAEAWEKTHATIPQMSDFWARHHLANATVTPEEAVKELIAAKRQDGLSQEYIHDLDVRLGRFAKSFSVPIVDITSPMLDAWLRMLPGSLRSRRNYRRALATLFLFCKERRWLSKEWDEMPKQGRVMASTVPVAIYTPEELKKLLAAARWAPGFRWPILPMIVLGAFAGLRTAEIQRLDWSQVGQNHIAVTAKRTRSQSRRPVPILPALRPWLKLCRKESGPVCRYKSLENHTAKLAQSAGLEWKHNGLRHSFISCRVEITKNVGQVALECGNSPQMIFQHYLERVTAKHAREWFGIKPENVKETAFGVIKASQRKTQKVRKPA